MGQKVNHTEQKHGVFPEESVSTFLTTVTPCVFLKGSCLYREYLSLKRRKKGRASQNHGRPKMAGFLLLVPLRSRPKRGSILFRNSYVLTKEKLKPVYFPWCFPLNQQQHKAPPHLLFRCVLLWFPRKPTAQTGQSSVLAEGGS